jgi:uncharacterized protein (DUF1499 family)
MKDRTLQETYEYCCNQENCDTCEFRQGRKSCPLQKFPAEWDIPEPHAYTKDEVAMAKQLLELFPSALNILRTDGYLHIMFIDRVYRNIADVFPSVRENEVVELRDIAEAKDVI